MPKPSHRDKILSEGLRVVHEHGFAGASVRDIVKAAGVPQGSFTNHFASKEAFALEVIELYLSHGREIINATLLNEKLTPLTRLAAYLDSNTDQLGRAEMRNGCLFGNFSAEASAQSEVIRARLVVVFGEIQRAIAACLKAAVKAGEVSADTDCDEIAGFVVSSMQGATLLAKTERSAAPVQRFKRILFSNILRTPQAL